MIKQIRETNKFSFRNLLISNKCKSLRCTLMGREICYPFKIPTNQLINKTFSTMSNNTNIDPWFFTGFADAESSFSVSCYKNNKLKIGWELQPAFSIGLHLKDLGLLLKIKSFFNEVGRIKIDRLNNKVQYTVTRIKDLNTIIIPRGAARPLAKAASRCLQPGLPPAHFIKYPLHACALKKVRIFIYLNKLLN